MAKPWESYQEKDGPWSKYAGEYTKQPEEMSILDSVKDIFTGESRQTRATEDLSELETGGGFLSGLGDNATNAKVAAALSVTSDPAERAKILQSNYPEIGIQYDEKGNVIAGIQGTDKRVLLNAPGLSATDLFTGAQQALLSIPAAATGGGLGAAAKVAQTGLQQGAVTGAIEAGQESVGGDFNAENVITDMLLAGAGEAVPQYLKYLKGRKASEASKLTGEAVDAEAARVGSKLSPEAQLAQQTEMTSQIAKAATKPKKTNIAQVASDVAPQKDIAEAAERLGVESDLTPGMTSGSKTYREIEGAVRAIPGTQLSAQGNDAILKVSQKADDLIEEFGGSIDKTGLSQDIKDSAIKTISDLDNQGTQAYNKVNELVSPEQKVDMSDVFVELQEEADRLGGKNRLEPFERNILDIAESNPSYALIDKERKKIGAALQKKQGAYKDMDSGRLKRMYGVLTDAQGSNLSDEALDAWNVAKGLTKQRKQLEDQSIQMFGKNLSDAFMPKIGASMKNLSKGDYGKFDQLIKTIPDKDTREKVVLSALNDVFTQGSRKEKQLSPAGFVDWYDQLKRQPQAMKRITSNLPAGAAKRLDDIYLVSKGIRDANADVTKTGIVNSLFNDFDAADGALSKIYQIGKQALAAEGVTTSAGAPGAGTIGVVSSALGRGAKDPVTVSADKLISSPAFKTAVKEYAGVSVKAEAKQKAAELALKKSATYEKWYEMLPSEDKRAIIKSGFIAWLGGDESETQQ